MIDLGTVARLVTASTSSISSTLTLLLVSGMLVTLLAIGVGLAGRLAAHIAWRWVDWQEDLRDEYRWHLRDALRKMAGCGLNPNTIIALALRSARARVARGAERRLGFLRPETD